MHYPSSSRFAAGFRGMDCHIHLSRATPRLRSLWAAVRARRRYFPFGLRATTNLVLRGMMDDGVFPVADWACLAGLFQLDPEGSNQTSGGGEAPAAFTVY